VRLAEVCCVKLFEQCVRTWQAVRNCFCELSATSFDVSLSSAVRKNFSLIRLTSLTGFLMLLFMALQVLGLGM